MGWLNGYVGHAPDPDRREEQFYSYFNEIWADSYEQDLAQQYAAYLPYLPKGSDFPFLDIGCGAGEFIQFLSIHGIPAQDIDSNATEVARAKGRGRNARCADALSYLHEHSEFFSGISLIEVIEHISPDSLAPLLSAICRALAHKSVVLLETINVKNSLALNTFYTDPTNTRPIPSDYLAFLAQWVGFADVTIVYSGPMAFTHDQSRDPSRAYFSYTVIAKKR